MRKLFGSLAAAGVLAAVATAPAFADLAFCLVDPPVVVDGTTLQVGLYTRDAALAEGGINGHILVLIRGERDSKIATDTGAWSAHHPTDVTIVHDLRDRRGGEETVEIDAFVPTSTRHQSVYLTVQMPNGSTRIANGQSNSLLRLLVEVPVQQGDQQQGGQH